MKRRDTKGFIRLSRTAMTIAVLFAIFFGPFSPIIAAHAEAYMANVCNNLPYYSDNQDYYLAASSYCEPDFPSDPLPQGPCEGDKECLVITRTASYGILNPGYGIGVRSVGETANQICIEQGYENYVAQSGYWDKYEWASPGDNYQKDYVNGQWTVYGASGGNDEIWQRITCQRTVAVPSVAPTISWTEAPTTVQCGVQYRVTAAAHDDDGDLATVSVDKDGTPFAYAGGGDGTDGTSGNPTTDSGPRQAVFTAWATDSAGNQSETISHSVTIESCDTPEPNSAPSAPVVSGPTTGGINTLHTFTAVSNDSNGDTISYGFDWDNDGFIDDYTGYVASGQSGSLAHSWSTAGTYTIRVFARDYLSSVSGGTSHTITITDTPTTPVNTAPNAPQVQGPSTGVEDVAHQFTVTATDPQGDAVSYGLDWDNNGTVDGAWTAAVASGISATVSNTWNTPGVYIFRAFARDTAGLVSAAGSFTITITQGGGNGGNAAPVRPTVTGPTTGGINAAYTFTAVATDPDGDTVSYGFDWDNDGFVNDYTGYVQSGTQASAAYTWTVAGTYTFTVIARDVNSNVSEEASHTIVISGGPGTTTNTPPNTPLIQGPSTGVVNVSYDFTATATDPQGNNLSYGFDWDNNGAVDVWTAETLSGISASRSYSWPTAGAYTLGVVAVDSEGATSSVATHTITISGGGGGGNLTPSAPVVDGPSTGTTSVSYMFTATATDPEGQQVRYGFDWDNDGTVNEWTDLVDSNTPAGIGHIFTTAGTHTITIYAEDASGARSGATVRTITINASTVIGGPGAPVISSVTGPATGSANVSYTFIATASDSEGDDIQYAFDWNNDGTVSATGDEAWSSAVASGVSASRSMSWPTAGAKPFQVFARDVSGNQSAGYSYSITIAGTSTLGYTFSLPANSFTSEAGATAAFTVVLNTAPIADVTMPVTSSDVSEATTSVSSLIFTPSNWNVPQTVIVTGVDDTLADGNISYTVTLGPTTSLDLAFNNLPAQAVPLVNLDNEPAAPGTSSGGGGGGGGGRSGGPCIGFGCSSDSGDGIGGTLDDVLILIDSATPSSSGPSVPTVSRVCRYDDFIVSYMKRGIENNPDEVRKLQYYLNTYENAGLSVNGDFDAATEAAVSAYQAKYSSDILAPWGTNTPTGIVYITTSAHINNVFCSDNPEYRGNDDLSDILEGVLYPPVDNSQFEGDIGSTATSTNIAGVFGAITQDILDILKDIPWYPLLVALLALLGTVFIGQEIIKKDMKSPESKASMTRGVAIILTATVLNVLNTLSFMINPEWIGNALGMSERWVLGLDLLNLVAVAVICAVYLVSGRTPRSGK